MNTETIETEEKEKLDLAVEVKETSACERHVTVTVPRSDIEKYFDKQFDELVPPRRSPWIPRGQSTSSIGREKVSQAANRTSERLDLDGQPCSGKRFTRLLCD